MKTSSKFLALFAVTALALSPVSLHAQDQPPPPPMDNGGAPPPPADYSAAPPDNGAPPPPDAEAPAPDQGQGGDSGASFQQFYDQLGSQGQWVQTDDYGYAFQPNVTDPNWAPYTSGHWVYTDAGWTWASDEPWGWATYHYGRWVNIDGTGWCWVPGYQWAPAWVSWRYGGGYCGWAPLPPSSFIGVEFGGSGINLGFDFHFGSDCDTAYGIGPGCYNFIPVGYIGNPYYRGYYLDRSRNFVVINNTRNITNIYVSRGARGPFGGVNAQGPAFAEINRQSRTPIQQVRLAEAGQAGRGTLTGGTFNVYAPHINPATLHQARPGTVARSIHVAEINRGTSVQRPLAVNGSLRPTAPSEEAIRAGQEAMAHSPTSVATTARIKPSARLATPLTSLPTAAGRQARATDDIQARQQTIGNEQAQRQQRATDDIQARQQTIGNEQAQRQQRATDDIQARQQTIGNEQAAQQQRAAADIQARQQTLSNEQAQRQQRAADDIQTRQQTISNEQAAQQQRAATDIQARQQTISNEDAERQQRAAADLQARQQQATAAQEQRRTEATDAQQERAQALRQEQARAAAGAQQERAAAGGGNQQQHAPVQQERQAPAAQQRSSSQSSGNGNGKGQGNQ